MPGSGHPDVVRRHSDGCGPPAHGRGNEAGGIGAAIGLLLAVAFARLMSGLLYGVNATDPWAFGIVPVVLLSVAPLAAWVPARRATAVNPVRALKAE